MELKTWEVGFATTISLKAEDVIRISTVDGTVVTGKGKTLAHWQSNEGREC